MEQMDSITEHYWIKRYRSVAAVCALYPDAQTVETHLYLKLTSFYVNILIIHVVHFGSINISVCNFRSSSYNLNKCLVRKIYHALDENMRNPASNQSRATIGPPVNAVLPIGKRHGNTVTMCKILQMSSA